MKRRKVAGARFASDPKEALVAADTKQDKTTNINERQPIGKRLVKASSFDSRLPFILAIDFQVRNGKYSLSVVGKTQTFERPLSRRREAQSIIGPRFD